MNGPTPITMGTAGHVDHGKTALVEALTGVNTDRLAEERRRGLSIELGFAELDLDDGRSLSVIDVPGHERFVRTMVAGATGVDMFLMVVAADEGVMPQTREHLAVLNALDIRNGSLALTKCDRTDDEARALAREEAGALLPEAPLVEVSAVTGAGLEQLRRVLATVAADAERERAARADGHGEAAVLHVDRSFTLRGLGTVVTGTLSGGTVSAGDRVRILPRGIEARVRSVQVHNRNAERGLAGQRVALNLSGVSTTDVVRGDTVAAAGSSLAPTYRLDVELRPAGDGRLDGERLQVHHGTRSVPARVVDLGEGMAQLRLEAPLVARSGDRFVLRRIAPVETIGGGRVLDPAPRRHGPAPAVRERLAAIRSQGLDAVAEEERRRREAERARDVEEQRSGEGEAVPLDDRARLILALLESGGGEPPPPRKLADRLGIEPKEVVASLDRLVEAGCATRLGPDVYYATEPLEALRSRALELAADRGEIALPELRDALGTSRKYAQALLEHLDATKATVRHGDCHVLRHRS